MATIFQAKQGQNQGHAIVAGWNNQNLLKNITAYLGSDGANFLPVDDRNGYTPGVTQRLTNGGTTLQAKPIIRFTSPVITDGQIDFLYTTLLSGSESNKVTVRYHKYDSVGKADTFDANAWLNLNLEQLPGLQRVKNGYENFVWENVIFLPLAPLP